MYSLVGAVQSRLEAAGLATPSNPQLSNGIGPLSAGGNEEEDEEGERMDRGVKAVGYGHVGDGNLHLNVVVPSGGGFKPRPSQRSKLLNFTFVASSLIVCLDVLQVRF